MTPPQPRSSLRFAPDLQEAVVLREIDRHLRSGDRVLHDDYRKKADRIYARHADPASRRAAFQVLHDRLFRELEFDRPIAAALEGLGLRFETVLVARAWSTAEEEVDLGAESRTLGIRLMVDRFSSPDLRRFLHHELGHVTDMLDPAFGYRVGAPVLSPARRSMGDRFGILWDCVVDGRTARAGDEPLVSHAERRSQLQRSFPEYSLNAAETVVGLLWNGARPTYAELVAFARDPLALAIWCGIPAADGVASAQSAGWAAPVPGAPCPLCGFPTFAWERAIPEGVAARIAADFPTWSPARGACERCVEGYTATADVGGRR